MSNTVVKYNWAKLTHLQIGRYAEYYAMMEFTQYGYDVYSAEVDDKGIDFVIRKDGKYFDIQVKSKFKGDYIFFPKDNFKLRNNLFAAVVIFIQGKSPFLFLIPSNAWGNPELPLVSRDYKGKKSAPEYGINASIKNYPLLKKYSFEKTMASF